MRGVSVAAPTAWPRNDLRCGSPLHDTLAVVPAGMGFDACLDQGPDDLSVIWLAAMDRASPTRTAGERYLLGWGPQACTRAGSRATGHLSAGDRFTLSPTRKPLRVTSPPHCSRVSGTT
jgi:hypothetical protein